MQAQPSADLGPFGHWLAGFIDGEGCFLIPYRKDRDHWYCQFRIRVRADDADIINEVYARTQIGRVFLHKANGPGARGPLACWEVSSKTDCATLAQILNVYPLRAKKRRDFEIWRQAVEIWLLTRRGGSEVVRATANVERWGAIARLAAALKAERVYIGPEK